MTFIINILQAIGAVILWLFKKFFPNLIKKFSMSAVKYALQTSISGVLILTTLAFYGGFVYFIVETYHRFRNFLDYVSIGISGGGGSGGEYLSCFFELLTSSGIASAFNSAFAFTIFIVMFIFGRILYSSLISALKLISDEISKALQLI